MSALVEFKLSFQEEKLKERLIEEEVLTSAEFQTHWETYQKEYRASLNDLSGRVFEVNSQGVLVVSEFPSGKVIDELPLLPEGVDPPKLGVKPPQNDRNLLYLDPRSGKYMTLKSLKFAGNPLLFVPEEGQSLIAFKGFEKDIHMAQSSILIDAPFSQEPERFHYDLFLSPDQEYLFVYHREEGALLAISLSHYEIVEEFILVEGGSKHAINMTFDPKKNKAYITDNCTQNMHFIELGEELHLTTWKSGLGTLGNLFIAQEPDYIYLNIVKPYSVYYFNLKTMKPQYSVNLEGSAHSQIGAAADFMVSCTPKNMYLLNVATAKSSYIHCIDTKEVQVLHSDMTERVAKPQMVVFGVANPLRNKKMATLENWLVKKGVFSAEELKAFKQPKQKKPKPIPASSATGGVKANKKVEPPKDFVAHTAPAPQEDILELIGKKAAEKELPPEADEVIVKMIVFNFYQATLTNLEIHSTELFKLRKIATQVRKDLLNQEALLVTIPSILGKYTFETPISRAQVFEQLKYHKANNNPKYHLNLCPECSYPMEPIKGCLTCPVCEYSFDTPEELAYRPTVSSENVSFMPSGQMILPLVESNKVVLMNAWHQVLQVLEGKTAWIRELADAIVLPNLNILATDAKGNKVAEYNSSGKVLWKAKAMLKNPVKTVVYLNDQDEERFLIVELGGARIIEMDRKGKQHRKYPGLKTALDYRLKAPIDVQLTPQKHWLITDPGLKKVIEVDEKGTLVQSWGEPEGIEQPLFARRLPSGDTLIVEESTFEVKIFSPLQETLHSFAYWPPEDDRWKEKDPPKKVIRLHQGELLFVGKEYYYQFTLNLGTYRWLKSLPANLKSNNLLYRVKIAAKDRSIDKQKKVEDYQKFLKSVDFLADIPPQKLQSLAQELKLLPFKAGEVIRKDLGQGTGMYFIKTGKIQVIKLDTPMIDLGPSEVFGVIPIVLGAAELKAEVKAQTDCELFFLDRAGYQKVVIRFSQFFHLLREIALERQFKVKRFLDEKTQKVTDELNAKIMRKKVEEHPMFKQGNDAFYTELAAHLRPMAFLPDQDVFSRGESGGTLYFINSGQVGVLRKGERQATVMLEDGDVFGEMSLMRDTPRNATMRTLDYSRIYELDRNRAEALINKHKWLKDKLEDVTLEREELNQLASLEFEDKMGLARPDLPEVKIWSPLDIRENELVYFSTVLMDRVVGVDNSGELLWCAGKEPHHQYDTPYRIQSTRDSLLIVDSGNDRIVEVSLDTREILKVWKGEDFGFETPRSANFTQHEELLVADEFNSRIVKISPEGQIVWEYGPPNEIKAPLYAEETFEGTLLFCDAELHKVYELDDLGDIIWQYGQKGSAGIQPGFLRSPAFAQRLKSGETLIADTGNDRLVIVDHQGEETAVFYGTEEFPLQAPKHCLIRENGDILVCSGAHELVVRIDRWGEPIWGVVLSPPPKHLEEEYIQSAQDKWDDVFEDPFEKEMREAAEAAAHTDATIEQSAPVETNQDNWDDMFEDPFEKELREAAQTASDSNTLETGSTSTSPQTSEEAADWENMFGEKGDLSESSEDLREETPVSPDEHWGSLFDSESDKEASLEQPLLDEAPKNRKTQPLTEQDKAEWETLFQEVLNDHPSRITQPVLPEDQAEWMGLLEDIHNTDSGIQNAESTSPRKTQAITPEEEAHWAGIFEEKDTEPTKKSLEVQPTQSLTPEEEAQWADIFSKSEGPSPWKDVELEDKMGLNETVQLQKSAEPSEETPKNEDDLGTLEDNWDDIFGDD